MNIMLLYVLRRMNKLRGIRILLMIVNGTMTLKVG